MIIYGPQKIEEGKVEAHVIGALDHSLMTEHLIEKIHIEDNKVVLSSQKDLSYFYLLDRYGLTDHFTKALSQGFKFAQNGAIASTVCHDSHQLLLLGNDIQSIKIALDTVLKNNGGLVIVQHPDNKTNPIVETLPLPLAGIMSVDNPHSIAKKLSRMKEISGQLCQGISEPFMALSFMALPVIPKLKITDKGLVDVEQFKIIDLFVK
jgi:adenine deaminase